MIDENRARRLLRQQEATIDRGTLARIAEIRERALTQREPIWRRYMFPGLAGAVTACLLAVMLWTPLQGEQGGAPGAGNLADGPEFYQDLEFYMWLAESDMGEHG